MKKKKVLLIVLYIIIAIVLLAILFNITVIAIAQNIKTQRNHFLSEGPWKEEVVWFDTNGELYLICRNTEGQIKVNAYIQLNDQWTSLNVWVKQNSSVLVFSDNKDKTIFFARAKLKNCNLTLTFDDKSKIVLKKFPISECENQLPFDY